MNVSFLQDLLNAVAERGRFLIDRSLGSGVPRERIEKLALALISGRGEASGVALAREVLAVYRQLGPDDRRAFFRFLAERLAPDPALLREAAQLYLRSPSEESLRALTEAVESPRREFFRRLNLAPGATAEIVGLRHDLLRQAKPGDAALVSVDADLMHLLQSWFNRGFLVVRRIDWSTPAIILEKIIHYEAVHAIESWDDLRRRLDPADRRCFAFFHPSLIDEPLIFVEVALMGEVAGSIQGVLQEERKAPGTKLPEPSTAVFYSISNCQEGLKGISFGNFLIKQVVEELARELPSLKTFVTLSPVPQFARWLDRMLADDQTGVVTEADRVSLQLLKDPGWLDEADDEEALKASLLPLAAHYFLMAKTSQGRPIDPVARFHLGNGARLERLNWLGDVSEKGLREAHGLMVNYRYDLKEIEANHEAYANEGIVAASRAVRGYLRPPPKAKPKAVDKEPPRQLEPPKPATAEVLAPAPAGGTAGKAEK